jgi:general secretion pathway protein G
VVGLVSEPYKIGGGEKSMVRNKGFTLIEMLLVMVIIGFLSAILVMRASDYSTEAKTKAVKADLHTLKTAVEAYVINNGQTPDDGQLENALTSESNRLVDEVPTDPFGSGDYGYDTDGTNAYYVIYSVGSDGDGSATAGTDSVTETGSTIWVSNCKTNNHGG